MGLDMYLNAKRYVWNSDEELATALGKVFPEFANKRVQQIVCQAIYWRKANAIHKWFVDNVQGGEDKCRPHWVSRKQLEELRDLVLEVLKTKDASLLPPTSGFFFGSTEVDEYYWSELERTAKEIDVVLNEYDDNWEFEYHSSW